MNTPVYAQAKNTAAPPLSFTSVQPTLLQRKCACGGSPGMTGECAGCSNKRLTGQHRSTDPIESSTTTSILDDSFCSTIQPVSGTTRTFREPHFGQNFSQARVLARRPETVRTGLSQNKPPISQPRGQRSTRSNRHSASSRALQELKSNE